MKKFRLKRLLCVNEEGPGETKLVPFPIGPYILYIDRTDQNETSIHKGMRILVRHPAVSVGVLATVKNLYPEDNSLVLELDRQARMQVLQIIGSQNELIYAECRPFVEKKIFHDFFDSKPFQEKIDKLLSGVVRLLSIADEMFDTTGKLSLSREDFSEYTIGLIIDKCADQLNQFIEYESVEERLGAVLVERDVALRIDKVIDLCEHIAKSEESDGRLEKNTTAIGENTVNAAPEEQGLIEGPGRDFIAAALLRYPPRQPRFATLKSQRKPVGDFEILDYKTPTRFMREIHAFFDEYIVGQERAKNHIIKLAMKLRRGLLNPKFPIIGGFFCGPTGVGKTELVRVFAEYLFNNFEGFTLVPCANYAARYDVSRLKGAPPGYVGYDDPPLLSQANLDKPHFYKLMIDRHGREILKKEKYIESLEHTFAKSSNTEKIKLRKNLAAAKREFERFLQSIGYYPGKYLSIVLWDEIERADRSLFDFLLEILNTGKLPLMNGNTTSFLNSIQFFTSNINGREILAEISGTHKIGFEISKSDDVLEHSIWRETRDAVMKYFSFNPAFLGRIGKENIVVFHPLTQSDYGKILDTIYFNEFIELMNRQYGIRLSFAEDAKEFIVSESRDPMNRGFGARALRHVLERLVEDPLVNLIDKGYKEGGLLRGDEVYIDMKDEILIKRMIN